MLYLAASPGLIWGARRRATATLGFAAWCESSLVPSLVDVSFIHGADAASTHVSWDAVPRDAGQGAYSGPLRQFTGVLHTRCCCCCCCRWRGTPLLPRLGLHHVHGRRGGVGVGEPSAHPPLPQLPRHPPRPLDHGHRRLHDLHDGGGPLGRAQLAA